MEKPTEYSLTWEVTDEMTAKRIGSAGSKILSCPPPTWWPSWRRPPWSWPRPIWTRG